MDVKIFDSKDRTCPMNSDLRHIESKTKYAVSKFKIKVNTRSSSKCLFCHFPKKLQKRYLYSSFETSEILLISNGISIVGTSGKNFVVC